MTAQKEYDNIYRLIKVSRHAAMAQSVERYLGKVEVTGSSPVSSFKTPNFRGFFFIIFREHREKGHFDRESGQRRKCVW